jgi:hypothetical protein
MTQITIDNLAQFDQRIKGIVLDKYTPKAKKEVEKFRDKMFKHLKEGYARSYKYGIKPVSKEWAKRRGRYFRGSLFWLGKIYQSLYRTPVEWKKDPKTGKVVFSFKILPRKFRHPYSNKTTDWLAEYHETHGRPLWKKVTQAHYVKERDEMLRNL